MIEIKFLPEIGHVLDAWLPGKMLYDQIPGLAVGVVLKGELVYARGFGYSDIENKVRVTSETNFRIASISKMFTAVALLQLVEQQKLDLNDSLGKHLTWVKSSLSVLTIREILSHTGGILRDGDTSQWDDENFPDDKELMRSVERTDILPVYRGRFKYSSFGFALLGQVIQAVSGMRYEEYVSKNIFQKAHMEKSFPDFISDNVGTLAKGYTRAIPAVERSSFEPVPARAYAPAAGAISNIIDMARFVAAFEQDLLLTAQSKKEIVTAMVKTGRENNEYGLGCGILKIKNHTVVGHGGNTTGFVSRLGIDLENHLGVIVLSNSLGSTARDIGKGIFETIYSLPALQEKYAGSSVLNPEKYEGLYRHKLNDTVIASIGTSLIAFGPKENNPLNSPSVLIEKRSGVFEINSEDGYVDVGESLNFTEDKMIWGSMVFKKIST